MEKLIKGEPDWHEKINANFEQLEGGDKELVEIKSQLAETATKTELTNGLATKEPTLPVERKRKITFGTAEPSGESDGDIYFQYE